MPPSRRDGIFIARYGERIDYVPVRSLIEAGIPFALGSDGPLNPYLNIMFAVTHPARPSEAITVEQAVAAYARGSAYAEFQEEEKGTLALGKLADLRRPVAGHLHCSSRLPARDPERVDDGRGRDRSQLRGLGRASMSNYARAVPHHDLVERKATGLSLRAQMAPFARLSL